MRKQCAYCLTLNEPEAMLCAKCGGDLAYAQEVYGAPGSSAPGNTESAAHEASPRHGENAGVQKGNTCHCLFAPEDTGTGICQECHLPFSNENDNHAPPDSSASASSSAEPRRPTIVLALPGLMPITLGAGVLIGRDATMVAEEIATALASFPGVSRRHVWLAEIGDGLVLLDLGSHNGTWAGTNRLIPFRSHRVAISALPLTLRVGGRLEAMVTLEK